MKRSVILVGAIVTAVVCASCRRGPLPRADRDREFGKDAFVVIVEVDKDDPSVVRLKGTSGLRAGKLTTELPGAVFIVGVEEDVVVKGTTFSERDIILLTSENKHILAPPGITITVPKDTKILGGICRAGKLVVPDDSKVPLEYPQSQ